jgi:hypothetical protein
MGLAYKCGLTLADLEQMTIGSVLDFVDDYIERQKPESEKVRKASQSDFDSF